MGIPSSQLSAAQKRMAGLAPPAAPRKRRGEGKASIAKANRLDRLPEVLKLLGVDKLPDGIRVNAAERNPNGWERGFASDLQLMLNHGALKSFAFEPIDLRVGVGTCRYCPDFIVRGNDGTIMVYELKGHKWAAGMRAVKSAALIYPNWKFFLVENKSGKWVYTELSPEKP